MKPSTSSKQAISLSYYKSHGGILMAKLATQAAGNYDRMLYWIEQGIIVCSASLFVALCARITVPLPFTPVPLTLQNFGVLVVGLTLGSRRGFAVLALYLLEGASG